MATPQEREALLRQVDLALRARDLPRAASLAEQGVALGIEHPGLFNLAAHNAIEGADFDRAISLLERARALAPKDVNVLNTLGIALKRSGRWEDAARAYDDVVAIDPNYANAHFNKGGVLEGLDRPAEAEAAYRRAVALEPSFTDALGRLSYLAALRGDYDTALAFAERAVAGRPDQPPPALQLAQLAQLRGDHQAAKMLASRVLGNAPNDVSATLILAGAEISLGDSAPARHRLDALITDPAVAGDAHALALRLMGRVEEDAGDFDAAFAAFGNSKAEFRRAFSGQFIAPDGTDYAARAERTLRYFEGADWAQWSAHQGDAASKPNRPRKHVFLLGFPRSGTTLLEKTLAGHPDIVTMEEEESLAHAVLDFHMTADGYARLASLAPEALDRYRKAYWNVCHAAAPRLARKMFIDKMPLNTIFLPLIAKLFPDAKVLFAVRDPRDVVLSCLKQPFAMSAAMYEFTSLESTARLYDLVMQLGELYRANLGLDLLEARYEDLVTDFDAATQRICAFLGVEWNAAMRDAKHASRARIAVTPSAPQLARGLYDGSGQWRRYRQHLAPVMPVLEPWAKRFGYPQD